MQKSFSIGISWGEDGKYEVLVGEEIGINAGSPGISLSINYLITNLSSVDQLVGEGKSVGMSGGGFGLYFEKDWIWGEEYLGTSGGAGIMWPPAGGSANYAETRFYTIPQAWERATYGSAGPSLQGSGNYSPGYYGE